MEMRMILAGLFRRDFLGEFKVNGQLYLLSLFNDFGINRGYERK